jgi:hypothetical protein
LNLKFPKNQTCIHMIFPTGNDLRNKLWNVGQYLPDYTTRCNIPEYNHLHPNTCWQETTWHVFPE